MNISILIQALSETEKLELFNSIAKQYYMEVEQPPVVSLIDFVNNNKDKFSTRLINVINLREDREWILEHFPDYRKVKSSDLCKLRNFGKICKKEFEEIRGF